MKIKFLGATGTVTGSKYLVSIDNQRILVDCGLFQGYKTLRLRNWANFPISPKSIDAVLLTHAHIDHSGYLPLLVKQGFRGPIYATGGTRDLCEILLPDSGFLQEEDARRANKYAYSKHAPALPLYTKADAEIALRQFSVVDFNKPQPLIKNGTVTWFHAGHIIGASSVLLHADQRRLLFSGDLGRPNDPMMKAPEHIPPADFLVLESTYGDRLHDKSDPIEKIGKIIVETAKRGGSILIPAFAVGRAQAILYFIYVLKNKRLIPDIPVFLDSPMGISATRILHHHIDELRLSREICTQFCNIAKYTPTVDESKAIHEFSMPKIIISASGMLTGGRVLHHLKFLGPDPRNTILLTGYQAGGTRGDRLLLGEKEIKMLGEMVPIRAQIEIISNTSAHADYEEILAWISGMKTPPRKVFITHGEPTAALGLKNHIETELRWRCHIPEYLDEENLSP